MTFPDFQTLRSRLASAVLQPGLAIAIVLGLTQCAGGPTPKSPADVVVSVKEQKLAIYNRKGEVSKEYPVSTSKFGLGDKPGTYETPLGLHEVVAKIGHGAPSGAVFKSRHWTGEVIKPDSPGRDPIVSRIMWLRGMEKTNKNAYGRGIYIHGTAEERTIGTPVSYGCIRMKSRDVIDLFNKLPIGSRVLVTKAALPATVPVLPVATPVKPAPSTQPPIFLEPKPAGSRGIEEPEAPLLAENTKKGSLLSSLTRRRVSEPEPDVEPEQPVVAKNTSKTSTVARHRTPEPEPELDPQPVALRSPEPPTYKKLPGGGAVLYSAPPTGTTGPGIVLKSRRTATQGYQNQ